jgi:hypothetical protein
MTVLKPAKLFNGKPSVIPSIPMLKRVFADPNSKAVHSISVCDTEEDFLSTRTARDMIRDIEKERSSVDALRTLQQDYAKLLEHHKKTKAAHDMLYAQLNK